MSLTAYADSTYYTDTYKGTCISTADIDKALLDASIHIDSLTYNRIRAVGFDNLTDFQQDIIKDCVCRLAEFENTNATELNSMLSAYSLNGVSMTFNKSWLVNVLCGVAVPTAVYSELEQTGLCTGRLR